MLDKKVKGYRRVFKKYGVDVRALQWMSKTAQEMRFRELVKEIDFEGKTVLDVGCGFADILPFISAKTNKFEYTGVDLVREFIEVAKKRYPDRNFIERDYFENPMNKIFDIVLTSGTLNANIKNAIEFRKKAIRIMWDHATEVVVFNMAGGNPQPRNKKGNRVYYADSLEIISFCLKLTNSVLLRHNYSSNDFTIVMFK